MICNICDRLAAEIGELLMQQEKQSSVGERNEELEARLQESRQKLIDHRRLIHRQST